MANYVLIHGGWFGAWCWYKVVPLLQAAGHSVYTPTLSGVGEQAALSTPEIGLDTHIPKDISSTGAYHPSGRRCRHSSYVHRMYAPRGDHLVDAPDLDGRLAAQRTGLEPAETGFGPHCDDPRATSSGRPAYCFTRRKVLE